MLLLHSYLLLAKAPAVPFLPPEHFRPYIEEFNREDDRTVSSTITNAQSWEWMAENIPFFDASDTEMVRAYYFRWWSYRKHLKQTPDGWVITEFLPDVPWAGKDNTISCAAGHHIYEGRWLRNAIYVDDYCKFWFRKGGEPRRYSFWAADAIYARYLVNHDRPFALSLIPDLAANYQSWEKTHLDRNGLFWQIDDRDGMEKSIGGSGYRPTINSYMYGDATALGNLARLAGDGSMAAIFRAKSEGIRNRVNKDLWNSVDGFYETCSREHETFSRVRELIGFVPWYFNLPTDDRNTAWKQLFDPQGFAGLYGPTTAERRNPRFMFFDPHECLWNGPSWPFATTQTLVGMANLLNNYRSASLAVQDYFRLLRTYTYSHKRKLPDGQSIPWIDEDLNPDTGEWIARDILHRLNRPDKNRGEYYNHSTYADLIISGLVGLRPRADDQVEVNPLVPEDALDYFCVDRVRYHNRDLTILYDRSGNHYHKGAGLRIFADGTEIGRAPRIARLLIPMPN